MPREIVTAEMLAAGRRAFLRNRRVLDDLYSFYDCDLESFLRSVYRSMASARGL